MMIKLDEGLSGRWNGSLLLLQFSAIFCLVWLTSPPVGAAPSPQASAYEKTILDIQRQIEAGDFKTAGAMIDTAARSYPHDGGVENLQGVIEIEQGHTSAAVKAFSQAIADSPRLTGAYLNLSRIKMQTAATDRASRDEALRLSLKALQFDSTNDEALYQVATIQFWNKSYSASLGKLNKLSPKSRAKVSAEALFCADFAALTHREETTKAAEILANNPDFVEQDADICMPALRQARRADLIEELLEAARKRQALSSDGLRLLGLAHEAEGKLQPARASLEQAYAANNKSVEILEDLTRVANAANDEEGALGYLGHARDLAPGNADLAYEFGVICVRMGLLGEARKAITEALRLAPDNAEFNLGMGLVVSFSEDPAQSLPYLNRYRTLRPNDPEGLLALGTANFRARDYINALTWLRQAVANEKTAADAHYYLGRIARQQGNLPEATSQLQQSLAMRPDQAETLAQLGLISTEQRDLKQAASYFDQALAKDRDNYSANFGLLQIYARTNDPRRDQQSHRFDEVKDIKDQRDRQMLRVIEVRPQSLSDESR